MTMLAIILHLFLANPALGLKAPDLRQKCQGRLLIIPENGWIIVTCYDEATDDSQLSSVKGPRDGVPLCDMHDPTNWHPMYETELDCHYDHHHGMDPYDPDIVALLGNPERYTGQGISYPWQTPQENELKHRAYFWNWQINEPCVTSYGDLCAKAWRAQIHADMGILGANARVHSYWIEVMACELGTENCGIFRTGGWGDTGCLFSPYQGPHVPLEGEPENCLDEMKNGIPYRAIEPVERMEGILNGKDRNARVLWGYEGGNGMNINIDRLVFRNLDSWSAINRNDPQERNYYCPDFQCRFNGSLTTVANINTTAMEAGTDVGYVDRVGNRVDGCAAYSLDCAPYIKENWPGGRMVYAQSAQFPNLHPQDKSVYFEADQSPAQLSTGNEWWLVPTDHEPRP